MFKKTREFIVEEKDVTTVVDVVNREAKYFDYKIGNCGWAEEPTKWFIIFEMTEKKFGRVVKDLNEIGVIKLDGGSGRNAKVYVERKSD